MNPTDKIIRDCTFWTQFDVDFNRCCNVRIGHEQKRMTAWEKKFVSDLMKLAIRDGRGTPRFLSDRQISAIQRISARFEDVLGI